MALAFCWGEAAYGGTCPEGKNWTDVAIYHLTARLLFVGSTFYKNLVKQMPKSCQTVTALNFPLRRTLGEHLANNRCTFFGP